jgi:cobalt-zinc-cadmium resistance protein CzcA
MPTLQEGAIMFRVTGIPSTSLEESVRVSQTMDAVLKREFPQTKSVLATIGRAEKGETTDANYMEVLVDVKPRDEWPEWMSMPELSEEAMKEALEKAIPTVVLGNTQPIQMRVEELISGVRATLALKLYGPDLATLDRLAAGIKPVLGKVAGVADLSLEANKGKPQIVVKVRREEAARFGINADEILEVVQAGIGGKAGQHPARRRAPLRHPGAPRPGLPRQPAGDRRHSAAHPGRRAGAARRAWPRWRRTRATPSCAASSSPATRCCRWT